MIAATKQHRPEVDACSSHRGAHGIVRKQSAAMCRVQSLMVTRLELMTEVARNKWNDGSPIEDFPREQQVLEETRVLASRAKLPPDWVVHFFRLQIEAAKEVQYQLLARWDADRLTEFDQTVDLRSEIRPKLDRLTIDLISALADAWPEIRSGTPVMKSCSADDLIAGADCTTTLSLVPFLDGSAKATLRRFRKGLE